MNDLVVISNHNPQNWPPEQKEKWNEILFIPFPNVDPKMSSEKVQKLARNIIFDNFSDISEAGNVTIQGEATLAYYLISLIKQNPLLSNVVRIWVPTTERVSVEKTDENGQTIKISTFKFVQWREI